MSLEVGQEVVVTASWPIRPGGTVVLRVGDRGIVLRSTETHAAIEAAGRIIVVPVDRLRAVDRAADASAGEDVGEAWFGAWATEMDRHRRRRHRQPGD